MRFTDGEMISIEERETEVFARCCENCGKGMNKGYLLNDVSTICATKGTKCLQETWNIDDNNIDSHIGAAVDDGQLDFGYLWEELSPHDDYEWFDKDGKQGDIETLIPVLFSKHLAGDKEAMNAGIALLSIALTDDGISIDMEPNMSLDNLVKNIKDLKSKPEYIKDIISMQNKFTGDQMPKTITAELQTKKEPSYIKSVKNYEDTIASILRYDDYDESFILDTDLDLSNPLLMSKIKEEIGLWAQDQGIEIQQQDIILDELIGFDEISMGRDKEYEVKIKDDAGKIVSEFYSTKYEAEHRIGWITKQDTLSWDNVGNYDMGPELHLAYTSQGIQSLGYFIKGMRIEYDDKGNKMPISTEDVADDKFGDGNWSFIVSESEARQQRDNLTAIKEVDKAHYVALATNGVDFIPVHSPGYTDAVHEVEKICVDKSTDFAEVVTLEDALLWLDNLNAILASPPQYIQPSQFGLDFDISELNPALISQWITKINYRHPPKRLHHVSFNDEWDAIDDIDGKEHKVKVSFEDKIEVGINATTEDYYDELLHFLETTVITKDLTAFNFSSNGNNTDIYELFLEYLQDIVNAQDLTAFKFSGVEVINENPHFMVNRDFTLSCVTSSDIASEEHTHGWFDTDNSVHALLPALKRQEKGKPKNKQKSR
jgi:hypothetical protein